MNQQQRKAALRLAGLMNGAYWTVPGNEALHIEAAALLRSLAEEKQVEPVAWIHPGDMAALKHPREAVRIRDLPYWAEDIPLYTHPPAKQEPLTEEVERLRAALLKIADWDSNWGPFPENNEDWRVMAVMTAREAVPLNPPAPRNGE